MRGTKQILILLVITVIAVGKAEVKVGSRGPVDKTLLTSAQNNKPEDIELAPDSAQDVTRGPTKTTWCVIRSLKDVGIDIGPGDEQNPVNLKSNGALSMSILGDDPIDLLLYFEMGDLDIVANPTELALERLLNDGTFLSDVDISHIFGFDDVNGEGLVKAPDLSTMITYWGQEGLPFVVGDGHGPFIQSAFGQQTPEEIGTDPNATVNTAGFYDPAR